MLSDLSSPSSAVGAEPLNWSEDLEVFHQESSRDHAIEVLTRMVMIDRLGPLPEVPIVVDLGCSTGYLLEDLERRLPHARLVGIDMVMSGLVAAGQVVSRASRVRGDACRLPLPDASVDGLASANLLEHVPDDRAALAEIFRVLRPGTVAVLVVPTAPGLYDYYDKFLHHERRYGRGELAGKARDAGLEVVEDTHFGTVVFPAFWAVKKRNRLRYDHLVGEALEARVQRDYVGTQDSRLFGVACRIEGNLLRRHAPMPFGIRGLTVVRRPVGP